MPPIKDLKRLQDFHKYFKNLAATSAFFYSSKVSVEEMENAVKVVTQEGYRNVKVVTCPYWEGART
jgi:hypothetical protein